MAAQTSCSVNGIPCLNRKFSAINHGALLVAGLWLAGCSGLAQPTKTPSAGHLTVTPASADFGDVGVGTKQTQTVVILSDGRAPVTIHSVKPSGTGFAVDGVTAPIVLNPGANVAMTVSFTPSTPQSLSGTVVILSDAAESSISIPLSGKGTTATRTLVASVTQLSFGDVLVGANSSSTITLTNQGNSAVTIRSVTGAGAGFSVSGITAGTVVNPGQSTSFNVTFAPTTLGLSSGQAVVNSDGNSLSIPLSGTAVQKSAHAVDLSWNQSDDVTGYNVYRQSGGTGDFVKINSSVVPNPQFEDDNVASGAMYSYVVTSVGTDGTESAQSESVSVQIPQN